MFCRVCGFREKVWEPYRTSRCCGYGYESVTELPEVPWYCGTGCTELTDVLGTGMNVLQNKQRFGNGYECLKELTEVPGIVARAYRT